MTCIYFLITKDNFSAFHLVRSDEIYHFYAGATIELSLNDDGGNLKPILMGSNPAEQMPQYLISKNLWQGSRIPETEKLSWALIGATVSPGFDFEDFELGSREELVGQYPVHKALIHKLTRIKKPGGLSTTGF